MRSSRTPLKCFAALRDVRLSKITETKHIYFQTYLNRHKLQLYNKHKPQAKLTPFRSRVQNLVKIGEELTTQSSDNRLNKRRTNTQTEKLISDLSLSQLSAL